MRRGGRRTGLGDVIESALSSVGITEERVSRWLGRPCNCRQRKNKLNKLGAWAASVMGGKPRDEAARELAELAEDPEMSPDSAEANLGEGDTKTSQG